MLGEEEAEDPAGVDAAAAFCRLAPCALKAERKLPKNGLLVVGMFAMCAKISGHPAQ